MNVDEFVLWQREMQNRLEQERHFLQELHRHRFVANPNQTQIAFGKTQLSVYQRNVEVQYWGSVDIRT